jgi:hypothetical protein
VEALRDEVVPLTLPTILALSGRRPAESEPPGSLRAGFYVGVAGGLLTILTGRSLRSR